MRALLAFCRAHIGPAVGLAVGFLVWIYGVVSGAHELWTAGLQPWAWQVIGGLLFVSSVVAVLVQWHDSRPASVSGSDPKSSPSPRPTGDTLIATAVVDDISCSLYLGRVTVDLSRLESDLVIILGFIAFNGSRYRLRFGAPSGVLTWGSLNALAEQPGPLPPPSVSVSTPLTEWGPYSERAFELEQRVPRAAVDRIRQQVETERLLLDFRGYRVPIEAPECPAIENLGFPFWETLTVSMSARPVVGRLVRLVGGATTRPRPA